MSRSPLSLNNKALSEFINVNDLVEHINFLLASKQLIKAHAYVNRFIRAFFADPVRSPALVKEFTHIAQVDDNRIRFTVVSQLYNRIISVNSMMPADVNALSEVLAQLPSSFFRAHQNFLFRLAQDLLKKFGSGTDHFSDATYSELFGVLKLLEVVVLSMSLSGMEGVDYDKLWKPFYKSLGNLADVDYHPVKFRTKGIIETWKLVKAKPRAFISQLGELLKVGLSLSLVILTAMQTEMSDFVDQVSNFVGAMNYLLFVSNSDDAKWHQEVVAYQAAFATCHGKLENYIEFFQHLENELKEEKVDERTLFGVILSVQEAYSQLNEDTKRLVIDKLSLFFGREYSKGFDTAREYLAKTLVMIMNVEGPLKIYAENKVAELIRVYYDKTRFKILTTAATILRSIIPDKDNYKIVAKTFNPLYPNLKMVEPSSQLTASLQQIDSGDSDRQLLQELSEIKQKLAVLTSPVKLASSAGPALFSAKPSEANLKNLEDVISFCQHFMSSQLEQKAELPSLIERIKVASRTMLDKSENMAGADVIKALATNNLTIAKFSANAEKAAVTLSVDDPHTKILRGLLIEYLHTSYAVSTKQVAVDKLAAQVGAMNLTLQDLAQNSVDAGEATRKTLETLSIEMVNGFAEHESTVRDELESIKNQVVSMRLDVNKTIEKTLSVKLSSYLKTLITINPAINKLKAKLSEDLNAVFNKLKGISVNQLSMVRFEFSRLEAAAVERDQTQEERMKGIEAFMQHFEQALISKGSELGVSIDNVTSLLNKYLALSNGQSITLKSVQESIEILKQQLADQDELLIDITKKLEIQVNTIHSATENVKNVLSLRIDKSEQHFDKRLDAFDSQLDNIAMQLEGIPNLQQQAEQIKKYSQEARQYTKQLSNEQAVLKALLEQVGETLDEDVPESLNKLYDRLETGESNYAKLLQTFKHDIIRDCTNDEIECELSKVINQLGKLEIIEGFCIDMASVISGLLENFKSFSDELKQQGKQQKQAIGKLAKQMEQAEVSLAQSQKRQMLHVHRHLQSVHHDVEVIIQQTKKIDAQLRLAQSQKEQMIHLHRHIGSVHQDNVVILAKQEKNRRDLKKLSRLTQQMNNMLKYLPSIDQRMQVLETSMGKQAQEVTNLLQPIIEKQGQQVVVELKQWISEVSNSQSVFVDEKVAELMQWLGQQQDTQHEQHTKMLETLEDYALELIQARELEAEHWTMVDNIKQSVIEVDVCMKQGLIDLGDGQTQMQENLSAVAIQLDYQTALLEKQSKAIDTMPDRMIHRMTGLLSDQTKETIFAIDASRRHVDQHMKQQFEKSSAHIDTRFDNLDENLGDMIKVLEKDRSEREEEAIRLQPTVIAKTVMMTSGGATTNIHDLDASSTDPRIFSPNVTVAKGTIKANTYIGTTGKGSTTNIGSMKL